MEKKKEREVVYNPKVDYDATLAGLLEEGDYVIVPVSTMDISNIRTAVLRAGGKMEGRRFAVHKTINGAKIERTG